MSEHPFDWPDTASLVMPRDPEGRAPDPVLEVLSKACEPWHLVSIARALQHAGMPIPRKAEAEYAAALHWLLGHAMRSGPAWADAALADLRAMAAKEKAARE
jgi:hypothetical protein